MPTLHIESMSFEAFQKTWIRYPDTAPSVLSELDTLRYHKIPMKLAKAKRDACLQKADVEKLVEWKLKHGTYRPTLMSLVQSNTADLVKSTTRDAFAILRDTNDVMKALKTLTVLRGIGPATASLLLSVFRPDHVPFFSDELFRWTHWDKTGKTGWGRSIRYSVSEYRELLAIVEKAVKRLDSGALDIEKVAYVLGKEGVDIEVEVEDEGRVVELSSDGEVEEISDGQTTGKGTEGKEEPAAASTGQVEVSEVTVTKGNAMETRKGTKRKAREDTASMEVTRRSTRRKTRAL